VAFLANLRRRTVGINAGRPSTELTNLRCRKTRGWRLTAPINCGCLGSGPVHGLYLTGAQRAPDSRSKPNSRTVGIQHGDAALNALPAWLSFKEQLRTELPDEEWDLWVRPMFLLRAMPASANQKHLLAAIPANGRIQSAATNRLTMMREFTSTGRTQYLAYSLSR
jgi:hypothetical protein